MKALLYDWGGFNVWLFHAINRIHAPWLDRVMSLGTTLGGHETFPVYLALLALVATVAVGRGDRYDSSVSRKWLAVLAVFSIAYVLDGALLQWAKPFLDFPRPPLALAGDVVVVGQPEFHHSLPSGHASFAILIAASLWPILGLRGRFLAVCFVLWVDISRVSLGAHFPADVVAGSLSCLLIVAAVRALVVSLARYQEKY